MKSLFSKTNIFALIMAAGLFTFGSCSSGEEAPKTEPATEQAPAETPVVSPAPATTDSAAKPTDSMDDANTLPPSPTIKK